MKWAKLKLKQCLDKDTRKSGKECLVQTDKQLERLTSSDLSL